MAIIKFIREDNRFVMLKQKCIQDERRSWRARGLLAYLLSLTSNWHEEQKYIAQHLAWNIAYTPAYKQLANDMPIIKPFGYSQFNHLKTKLNFNGGDILNVYLRTTNATAEHRLD